MPGATLACADAYGALRVVLFAHGPATITRRATATIDGAEPAREERRGAFEMHRTVLGADRGDAAGATWIFRGATERAERTKFDGTATLRGRAQVGPKQKGTS